MIGAESARSRRWRKLHPFENSTRVRPMHILQLTKLVATRSTRLGLVYLLCLLLALSNVFLHSGIGMANREMQQPLNVHQRGAEMAKKESIQFGPGQHPLPHRYCCVASSSSGRAKHRMRKWKTHPRGTTEPTVVVVEPRRGGKGGTRCSDAGEEVENGTSEGKKTQKSRNFKSPIHALLVQFQKMCSWNKQQMLFRFFAR